MMHEFEMDKITQEQFTAFIEVGCTIESKSAPKLVRATKTPLGYQVYEDLSGGITMIDDIEDVEGAWELFILYGSQHDHNVVTFKVYMPEPIVAQTAAPAPQSSTGEGWSYRWEILLQVLSMLNNKYPQQRITQEIESLRKDVRKG